MYACMYMHVLTQYTHVYMYMCECVYGVSFVMPIRGILCTKSSEAISEGLYRSFPEGNSAMKHQVQTRLLLLLTVALYLVLSFAVFSGFQWTSFISNYAA